MVRRERFLLAWVVFAAMVAQILVYPRASDLAVGLGAADPGTGRTAFLAVEYAAFVVFAGAWGAASDAVGRRRPLIAAGALAGAAGYAAMPFVAGTAGFGWVLTLRVVQGAATVGAFSLAITMLMDLGGGHGRNMGAAGIAIGLGLTVGAPVGGLLFDRLGTGVLFGSAGALAAAGVLAVAAPDRAPGEDRSFLARLRELRGAPALGVPLAFGFVDRFTAGAVAVAAPDYFGTGLGFSGVAVGALLAAFFGPFALLQYPFGRLSDRVGRVLPVGAGSMLYGVGVAGVGLATTGPAAALAMGTVGVLGALMSPATMALVTDVAPQTARAAAMGAFNAAGSVGFLVGIVAGGAAVESLPYRWAFAAIGATELAVAAVALPALLATR